MPADPDTSAQQNLELGLANDPRSATPLAASAAYMALTAMVSHRGDGIPTQYVHGPEVAKHAQTVWLALLTALRARPGEDAALDPLTSSEISPDL